MIELSELATKMLGKVAAVSPDPLTIAPVDPDEGRALDELRDAELIEQWDMWPNGDRRWVLTAAGRSRAAR